MSKALPLPSQEELHRCFRYEPETGLFYWRRRPELLANWNARYPGTIAGVLDTKGHVRLTLRRRFYAAHRLAWVYVYGEEPRAEIDHINGVRHDNRITNLRLATRSQNGMNMAARGQWPEGVYRYKRDGSFRAQMKIKGRTTYLGMYPTPEAAHEAYRVAAEKHFGEFACTER